MALQHYVFETKDSYSEEFDENGDRDEPFGRRTISYEFDVNADTHWNTVLIHFLAFLSSVYGYDINTKVKFND